MSGSGGPGDLRPVGAAQRNRGGLGCSALVPDLSSGPEPVSSLLFVFQASIMTGSAISLGVDGLAKPPPEPILSHSRMSPLRRNSLLNQGNLIHQPPHLAPGAHLDQEAHLLDDAEGT